jgi:hypothetical protein
LISLLNLQGFFVSALFNFQDTFFCLPFFPGASRQTALIS